MSNIFEKLDLFSDFNEKQIKAIFKLGERKLINANDLLFKEGENSKGLYIVLGGKFSTTYNGVKKYFTAGAIFSILSLVNTSKHKLTVKSEQKSQFFYLTKERYDKLKENSPKFALKLQENLIRDYLKKTERLEKIFLEK
jgi:CRP-like cAMP-binding protein